MLLNYHELTNEPSPYLYTLAVLEFEKHLNAISAIPSRPQARIGVPTLTFDDGHVSHYEHAIPLLDRFGLHGQFCVTAGWTNQHPAYMTGSQLRELSECGHDILAHGWSHKHLTTCADAELDTELVKARKTLEDIVGKSIDGLSFPGGRWNRRVLRACARAGYVRAYCSEPWWHRQSRYGLNVRGRYTVTRHTTSTSLLNVLRDRRVDRVKKQVANYAKGTLRALVGNGAYHRIWCRYSGFDPDAEGVKPDAHSPMLGREGVRQ